MDIVERVIPNINIQTWASKGVHACVCVRTCQVISVLTVISQGDFVSIAFFGRFPFDI